LKGAMAHVSSKSHANGVLNPKAHLRKMVTEDQVMAPPLLPIHWDCLIAAALVTVPPAQLWQHPKKPENPLRRIF